jgi:hypothetical protein
LVYYASQDPLFFAISALLIPITYFLTESIFLVKAANIINSSSTPIGQVALETLRYEMLRDSYLILGMALSLTYIAGSRVIGAFERAFQVPQLEDRQRQEGRAPSREKQLFLQKIQEAKQSLILNAPLNGVVKNIFEKFNEINRRASSGRFDDKLRELLSDASNLNVADAYKFIIEMKKLDLHKNISTNPAFSNFVYKLPDTLFLQGVEFATKKGGAEFQHKIQNILGEFNDKCADDKNICIFSQSFPKVPIKVEADLEDVRHNVYHHYEFSDLKKWIESRPEIDHDGTVLEIKNPRYSSGLDPEKIKTCSKDDEIMCAFLNSCVEKAQVILPHLNNSENAAKYLEFLESYTTDEDLKKAIENYNSNVKVKDAKASQLQPNQLELNQ